MEKKKTVAMQGLYAIAIKRLEELQPKANPKTKIIRFPIVFQKLCRCFCINKKQGWELLFTLRDCGMIEIVPFQGIKIQKAK